MSSRVSERKRGFTIVEVAIASVVFGIILSATLGASMTAQKGFNAAMIQNRLDMQVQRVCDVVVDQFQTAGKSNLTPTSLPPLGSDRLTYRRPTGIAAGAVTWAPASTVLFEYAANEPNNGLDDDGDGLVDEGRIVLVRNAGLATESRVVLAANVPELMPGEIGNGLDDNGNGLNDERGLSFSFSGSVLTVRIALCELDGNRRLITSTQTISLQMRN